MTTQDDLDWARTTLAAYGDAPADSVDPARAALAFAIVDRADGVAQAQNGDLDRAACEAHFDALEAAARPLLRQDDSAEDARAALAEVIATRFAYEGDVETYEDLQNADVIRVIQRKRGLPVALGALYASLARRVGVEAHGLAFPGHFLMRIEASGGRAAFDPFHAGAAVGTPEMRALVKAALGESAELKPDYFDTVTAKQLVIRLRNNIKVRLLRSNRLREAAVVAEGMAAFAPEALELLREIGLIRARLGELTAARRALDRYIAASDDAAGRRKAAQLLDEIERRLQ